MVKDISDLRIEDFDEGILTMKTQHGIKSRDVDLIW